MTEDKFDLSRRKVLGSLGVVGTGAVLGGAGTAALFSDEENSTNNSVTAGELDLVLDVSSTHNMGFAGTEEGDGGAQNNITLGDVKPGDDGSMEICFEPQSNPAWVWMNGEITADTDNIDTEPEEEAEGGSTDGDGELDTAVEATLKYSDGSTVADASGTLRDVIEALNGGVLLDADPSTDSEDYFTANSEECLVLDWEVPIDVGNEIQGDEVKFDLTLYAEQRRHNESSSNPF